MRATAQLSTRKNGILDNTDRGDHMTTTVQHEYRGWNITIECMERPRPVDHAARPSRYSANACAALQTAEIPEHWVDPRVQLVSLGERIFFDRPHCIGALLTEVKSLIDALKREPAVDRMLPDAAQLIVAA
jgi:hypothetical protein